MLKCFIDLDSKSLCFNQDRKKCPAGPAGASVLVIASCAAWLCSPAHGIRFCFTS